MIKLIQIKRTDERITSLMKIHYSQPKGFVGRNICYAIYYDNILYGAIVGGSCCLHLPNRNEFFGINKEKYNNIVNNIFYHIEKVNNKYPCRWFTVKILLKFEEIIKKDWKNKYNDEIIGFESLVEPPRTGNIYLKAGYTLIGQTKGFTCKRTKGKGSDNWTGKRIWNTKELRPKLVFCKKI